jgi:hypothetical protein
VTNVRLLGVLAWRPSPDPIPESLFFRRLTQRWEAPLGLASVQADHACANHHGGTTPPPGNRRVATTGLASAGGKPAEGTAPPSPVGGVSDYRMWRMSALCSFAVSADRDTWLG